MYLCVVSDRIIHVYLFCVHAVAQADDASKGMAAGKLREAAARGNLQEVLRLIEEGAKIQSDEVSICTVSYLLHWCAV